MKKIASLILAGLCLLPLAPPAAAATPRWGWSEIAQHSTKTWNADHLTAALDLARRVPSPMGPNPPERPAFVRVLESGFFAQRRLTNPSPSNS